MGAAMKLVAEHDVLVQKAAAGDREAFSELVRRYQNTVTAVALSVMHRVSDSEEVGQRAFCEAWRALPSLKRAESFGPWLLQLTRNQALQELRSSRRRRTREANAELGSQPESPESTLLGVEQSRLLQRALEDLPSEASEILLLFYREGCSAEQVAVLLSLTPAAVRKRLERARGLLREQMAAFEYAAKRSAPVVGFAAAVMASLPAQGLMVATSGAAVSAIAVAAAVFVMAVATVWWHSSPLATTAKATAQTLEPVSAEVIGAPRATAIERRMPPAPAPEQKWAPSSVFDETLGARLKHRVTGRVSIGDGSPASGARVIYATDRGVFFASSNAQGDYELAVPEGRYRVAATLGRLATANTLNTVVSADQTHHLELAMGGVLSGTVHMANGMPAVAVDVKISTHGFSGDTFAVRTDESGTFVLEGLPAGAYDLSARHVSVAREAVLSGVTIPAGGRYFAELRFDPSRAVLGKVMDDRGQALALVELRLSPEGEVLARTNADGSFESVAQWPTGRVRLFVFDPQASAPLDRMAWPSGHLLAIVEQTIPSVAEQTTNEPWFVVVPSQGSLFVSTTRRERVLHLAQILSVGGFVPGWQITKQLNDDGSLSLPLSAGRYFASLSESLAVAPTIYGKEITVVAGEAATLRLDDSPDLAVRVQVREADGAPVFDAELIEPLGPFRQDPDGTLWIAEPKDFPARVIVQHGSRVGAADLNAGQHELQVRLDSSGTLKGTVRGAAGAYTVKIASSGRSWRRGEDARSFDGPSFDITELPVGPAVVTVTAPNGAVTKNVEILLHQETTSLFVLGPTGSLQGLVRMKVGALPTPTPVVILDHTQALQSSSSGEFAWRDIAAGRHHVAVEMLGKVCFEADFDVVANETLYVPVVELDN